MSEISSLSYFYDFNFSIFLLWGIDNLKSCAIVLKVIEVTTNNSMRVNLSDFFMIFPFVLSVFQ